MTDRADRTAQRQAERTAELADALAAVRARIARACAAAGRAARDVELVAVTKTHPATDVALLMGLGLRVFGENRAREAAAKVAEVAELCPGSPAAWHLVGQLQRNKVRSVVGWVSRVESVDSLRLVETLDAEVRRAWDRGERADALSVLVQLSLDGDPARGGVPVAELEVLSDRIAESPRLRLDGLMAVAPLNREPDAAFGSLAEAAAGLRQRFPAARVLSAGMTDDLERAIEHGSTCVRVGTALLGDRRLASP